MTPEAINAAIALHLGWKFNAPREDEYSLHDKGVAIMCWSMPGNDPWQTHELRNYAGDLNAMHQAESHLREGEQTDIFERNLYKIVFEGATFTDNFKAMHATALQRAEAFLGTVGKWQESPEPVPV